MSGDQVLKHISGDEQEDSPDSSFSDLKWKVSQINRKKSMLSSPQDIPKLIRKKSEKKKKADNSKKKMDKLAMRGTYSDDSDEDF